MNAGLHDQYFGLEWVQSYISLFGGNASAVTIMGESAGGGSVMLMGTAYGGTVGSKLFQNVSAILPSLRAVIESLESVPGVRAYNVYL